MTLLVAAYNEEDIIADKMNNTRLLDYPKEKLHVVWVTDDSTDNTVGILKSYSDVRVLHKPERRGKTAAINRSMTYINTPIVVLTDANAMLNKESIKK
ncbi:glycosyltransferase [Dysgonomonas reticulitermitis]